MANFTVARCRAFLSNLDGAPTVRHLFIHLIYTQRQAGYNECMESGKEVKETSKNSKEKLNKRSREIIKIVWTVLVYIFAAIGFFLTVSYFVIRFGFSNTSGIIDLQRQAFLGAVSSTTSANAAPEYPNGTPWQNTQEWTTLSAAITKDAAAINQASAASGVPARLIIEDLVVEQLRLFFTERGYFKQFFAPLQILGAQTQFSLGVMGMKDNTAAEVEENLKNSSSPFYPGDTYAHLLDYTTNSAASSTSVTGASSTSTESATSSNITELRYTRLTDQHNHYYSYLYAGLYIKEIEAQWQKAGFPITNRPDVLATLYNIGFEHSNPNANPQVGGAAITINGVTYSFGALALQFYNSNFLTNLFPKQ